MIAEPEPDGLEPDCLEPDGPEAMPDPALGREFWPGYVIFRDGSAWSLDSNWRGNKGPRRLSQPKDVYGYPRVIINVREGRKRFRAHRLVAEAFLGPPPGRDYHVYHKDGDRENNHVENLAWGTAQDIADGRERRGTTATGDRNGTHTHPERLRRGESNQGARLTEREVREIRMRWEWGESIVYIAGFYDLHQTTVAKVVHWETWKHVE